ncbi:hypothetical protein PanWU01x14_369320 [Parasponia andersonii]|uniref:Uncharacterized protein n=1 Tax=Parasponia andersonii TaxID=3476 RepID=A0A2P5A4P6_PARAD|nr:hypothetical protein PanWU01x14_369320 [Parasponia andersonii]
MDPPSHTNDCFRVDMVKESVVDKHLGDFPIDTHEAPFHSFDVEGTKDFGDIDVNLLEVSPHVLNSKPRIEFMEASLSSCSHHKPYKEKTKKWCVKIKKKSFELN